MYPCHEGICAFLSSGWICCKSSSDIIRLCYCNWQEVMKNLVWHFNLVCYSVIKLFFFSELTWLWENFTESWCYCGNTTGGTKSFFLSKRYVAICLSQVLSFKSKEKRQLTYVSYMLTSPKHFLGFWYCTLGNLVWQCRCNSYFKCIKKVRTFSLSELRGDD